MMGDRSGLLTRFQRRINGAAGAGAGAGAGGGRAPAALAALVVAAVFAAIALLGLTRATDSDLHWHLAAGRLIRTTGEVPGADPFSYTAYGLPWVDVQWLFQIGASLLFDAGGFRALTFAAAVAITGLFVFLYRRGGRIHAAPASGSTPAPASTSAPAGAEGWAPRTALAASASAALILLAALAAQERFLTRPEVLSWWLLALVLAGLDAAAVAAASTQKATIDGVIRSLERTGRNSAMVVASNVLPPR